MNPEVKERIDNLVKSEQDSGFHEGQQTDAPVWFFQ
jgi:hypothetical protein